MTAETRNSRIGEIVSVSGECSCRKRPRDAPGPFHDLRDCYHGPSMITLEFSDGSIWVVNPLGFGRRMKVKNASA
jgi:hypothetical protein